MVSSVPARFDCDAHASCVRTRRREERERRHVSRHSASGEWSAARAAGRAGSGSRIGKLVAVSVSTNAAIVEAVARELAAARPGSLRRSSLIDYLFTFVEFDCVTYCVLRISLLALGFGVVERLQ